jgi:hypothetical protein
LKSEYNLSIILPLVWENSLPGALFIYAAEAEVLIKQEISPLETLTRRISRKLGPVWKDGQQQQ